jgi:hypothetical protein
MATASEGLLQGAGKNINAIPRFLRPFALKKSAFYHNCGQCAIYGDQLLAGAKPGRIWWPTAKFGNFDAMIGHYGRNFKYDLSIGQVEDLLSTPGARGVLFMDYKYKSRYGLGHVVNVVNDAGVIRYIDFQQAVTGPLPTLSHEYGYFHLLQTQ